MATFNERFNQAFKTSNLTQSELGRRANIQRATIHDYLTGRYSPKKEKLDSLARALNVNPDWLAGANVSMNGQEKVDFLSNNIYLDDKLITNNEKEKMANFARGLRAARGE